MKKTITSSIIVVLMLLVCSISFGQTQLEKDYAKIKSEYISKHNDYLKNISFTNLPEPEDPLANFIEGPEGNLIPVSTNPHGKAPFVAPYPIGPGRDAVTGYQFVQSTQTYNTISGGTLVASGGGIDDNTYTGEPIGFTFHFNSTPYTTLGIDANGYIWFGAVTPASTDRSAISMTVAVDGAVSPMSYDMLSLSPAGEIRIQTQGSAPNRTCTVQFKNWTSYSVQTDTLNFQVILYETSDSISMMYGYCNKDVTSRSAQVGMRGATNADFLSRTTATNWSATTAGVANTDACTLVNTCYPSNGLTFTYRPPAAGNMTYISSTTAQVQPGVPYAPSSVNDQIIKVSVVDTGSLNPISITKFKFETQGSNNPVGDISNAKVYFTGSTNTFSTATQFGSTVTGPNGVFYVNGSQALVANATNYFWLTYDLTAGAVTGDSVDAQCDSITGSGSMGTVVPAVTAPAGSNPIDIYCIGTYSTAGCPYGLYIANVNFAGINNASGCNGNLPYCYTSYTNTTPAVVRQNNPYTMTITDLINPNTTAYGIYIDWNNNGSFADAGEYYAPPVIPPSTSTTTSMAINVPVGATLGNHRMRIRCAITSGPGPAGYCSALTYGEQEDYTVTVLPDTNMTYLSSTTTQTNTSNVFIPSVNTQIIGMTINVVGSISPINATSFTLNTTGSTNPATDISKAKLWYTGASPVFATTSQVGSDYNTPSGTFIIAGSQTLQAGANYFWLTYDVPGSATINDTLDAQCTSITIGGTPRTPTITAPAGNRVIAGTTLCGTYTIPGSYPTIAAAINAVNTVAITCPVVFNVAAGYTETAANLVITGTGTAANTVTFRKNGTGANPLITAGVGTGTYDGIIKFYGASYITFDGIDLQENVANTTQTTQMEWGYALLRPDATHGDQFITIKNCNITLNKTNSLTYGVYSNYMNLTGTLTTPTNPTGTNSNNSFLNVNISNSQSGFYLYSNSDGTFPFSLEDHDNTINTSGSGRSSVTNFGNSAVFGYGVYAYYQSNFTCNNTYVNSRGGVNSTYYLEGIYNYHYYDNGNSTISGDTITLADTTGSTGYLYGIYNYGYYGNNDVVTNNVVKDCVNPATSSTNYYIYNYCASGSQLYRTNITITGNKVINNHLGTAGVSTGTAYPYYLYSYSSNSINISNNLDSANVILGTTCYVPYVFYCPGASNNVTFNRNRIVNDTIGGTTATGTTYGIYYGQGLINSTVDSNVVANNVMPTTSTQSLYSIYNFSSAASTNDYSYNTVSNNYSSGAGTIYGIFFSASPAFGSTVNITNNTVTNLQKYTATGAGTIYGIYQGSTPQGTLNINNNTITGFNSVAATTMYGIYQASSPPNYLNINNNSVGNFTNGGVATMYGIYGASGSTTTQENISQDSVYNLVSPGGTIYGIYSSNGNPVNIFKNKVLGLTSNTATAVSVYGMYIGAGTVVNVYNNFISDLNAPASTSISPSLTGLYIGGGTFINAYYNTIYLKAVSSSVTTFGSTGIYASTTPTVDLRNNAVVNISTPGPTGGNVIAYQRSANSLPTYSVNSNNNCFYAGTPAANKLIFFDGTNLVQTLTAYKTLVSPKDGASATELPPFMNGATAPYDLRISPSTATQLESGGQIISTSIIPPALLNITTDAFGTARYPNSGYPVGGFTPTAPDIGANEFGGLQADVAGPLISYTALGIGGTGNRAFNNVIITDPSGVNVTTGTKPRCYYKRSTDGNVINDNTSGTDGWKYVESNGATSPFDFTINYSLLNGGTGVIAGQVVNYFVIAQDLASTPNVNWNQATFTANPTTVALSSGAAPITNTLSYTIGTATFSGTYSVGTAQTYTSLTGAGGIFAAMNAATITGNVTISITSDMTEDGTNALNLTNESGIGGYKITIVPATASMKTISGSVAQAMIRFNGSRRVTVDGNGGLGAKYLTFRNYYGTTPTIQFQNEAGMDTLKNCYIESNNTSTASGTIYIGTTTGVNGNDSICVNSCDIRDRSDVAGTPANAIYGSGTITTLATYNNWCSVINCNIYNYYYDGGAFTAGVYLNTGCSDWTISGNSFYQTASRAPVNASTFIGAFTNTATEMDIIVTNNYFGGSAPNCGGTAMTYNGTGAYSVYGIYLFVGNLVPSSVQNNTIQNINLTYTGASTMNFFRAIWAGTGYVNIGNIAGNTIGSGTGTGSITLTTNTSASAFTIAMIYHAGFGSVMNNTIGSITFAGNSTGTSDLYAAIYWSNTLAGQIYTISNNLIGSQTTANSIQVTNNLNYHALRGVYILNGAGTINNVTNNTVANLTSLSTITTQLPNVYGIQYNSSVNAVNTFTGNTVRNLAVYHNDVLASFAVGGIFSAGYGSNTFSQNNIYSLYSLGTTGAQLVGGILAGGYYNGGVVSQNKIYDLKMMGTAAGGLVLGINVQGYTSYNVTNNMISLTNGDASDAPLKLTAQEKPFKQVPVKNPPINLAVIPKDNNTILKPADVERKTFTMGLYDEHSPEYNVNNVNNVKQKVVKGKNDNVNSTNGCQLAAIYHTANTWNGICNFYYNTFYIGGTQPGASAFNSAGFFRSANGRVSLVNNFIINVRTGGTLNHYCVSNEGSLIEGWPMNSANYNVYLTANDNTVGEWGAGNALNMAAWRTISTGDNQSWETNSSTINPLNLLTSVGTGNLGIVTGNASAWLVSGKGIAIAGQNIDYFGTARVTSIAGGCTDIGAMEFAATPPSNPAATQVGTPGSGTTTTYTLYGRTICSVDWGTGGTSYPTALTINYQSGLNPAGFTIPAHNSNSYWSVVPTGTLAGTTYDITFYFGDNETYSIASPNTNTLLARNNFFWQVYPGGTGNQMSDVSWPPLTAKVRGLTMFLPTTVFALADASFPEVKLLTPADGAPNQLASLNLVWNKSAAATSYRVQLGRDSTFNSLIVVDDSTVTDSIRAVTGLIDQTNYYWRVKGTNALGMGAYSMVFKFRTNFGPPPPALVNMNVIPGGFYNTGTGKLNMRDTLRVLLIDSATCNRLDSCKVVVDSVTFGFQASFSNALTGNYYLFVFHRNHLPISSRLRQTITRGNTVAYDFTNDSTKTYGNNVTRVATGKYGMIPGDANRDQFVDGLDQTIWFAQNGLDGYNSADFNGDGFVDGLDQTIWILYNGNGSFLPCNISVPDVLRWEKAQVNRKTVGNININPLNINVTDKKK